MCEHLDSGVSGIDRAEIERAHVLGEHSACFRAPQMLWLLSRRQLRYHSIGEPLIVGSQMSHPYNAHCFGTPAWWRYEVPRPDA